MGGVPYVLFRVYSNGTSANINQAGVNVTKIGVSSNSAPLRAVFAEPPGIYASDVIAVAAQRKAPQIRFTTGPNGTIQPTTFPIPHLVFDTPSSVADVIAQSNAYHQWDWFVWEGPTLHFQPPGTGVAWEARNADGAQLSLEGDDASGVYDRVFVSYTDAGTARQKLAGWPGSGFDVENASLLTTDPNNPVVANLRSPRSLRIDLSFPTTDAGAVQVGSLALGEANLAARSGSITVTGMIRAPDGSRVPVSRIRAGDTITMSDAPDTPPRRIVETSYTHASLSATLTINSTAQKLQALLERLVSITNVAGG
jgi:hypothetical protein